MDKRWTWLVLILVALMAFAGCSSDDDPTVPPPAQSSFENMAEAGAAYINGPDCPGLIAATDLNGDLASYTVIDIRSPQDYAKGHIPGAINSSLATLLNDLTTTIPAGKPYVVTCYSGQSAGYAKIAMEMAGYTEVYSLKWGMSSWSLETAYPWNDNTADLLTNPEQTDNNGDLVLWDYPTLTGDPSTIAQERAADILTSGFQSISYDSIKDNLGDYFIINYFSQDDYLGQGTAGAPGHIPGAYQFTPKASLAMDEMLDNLPNDGTPIVVYCWTGQNSAQVTGYLNMCGYNAYSLLWGANALYYSDLTANAWGPSQQNDFAMEVGYPANDAFTAMSEAGSTYLNGPDCPGIISAQDVYDNLADLTVIDLRSQVDYDAGHIQGAYHSSLGTLLADMGSTIPGDKAIVVACYTGQTAGHAKIALELMGYAEVYSLGWGMASWSSEVTMQNYWTNNCQNNLPSPNATNENVNLVYTAYPDLAGQSATIVEQQVAAMLSAGFKGVNYTDIEGDLQDYFIINYFGYDDYIGEGTSGVPGHIPGAYQFTPQASMAMDEMLGMIPSDMPVVVYCWTGQHSSQVTAYLNMCGYEAYSLKFGSNNLFYESLTAHKWVVGTTTNSFPLVATPGVVN